MENVEIYTDKPFLNVFISRVKQLAILNPFLKLKEPF